ncbi:MAG TPA: hypothetical protein VD861_04995 [Pyrinomonadaceae bacterium]|nr:hypothetical protein [Pyrinomonadaceae bacterium]
MKRAAILCAILCALMLTALLAADARRPALAAPQGDALVYADFESVQDNRPVSKRGGWIQLNSYEETTRSKFKGLANASPGAPELVRLKQDDPNKAAAFDYELYSPNQYAGVALEVQGQPQKDGKPVADDVSAYKYISMQVYATGVPRLRVELVSRGQGMNMSSGFPQAAFKLKSGFNTYKIPLNTFAQPSWVEMKVDTKDVLKKLTAVSLSAFCDGGCSPMQGTVVVDNITFEK